MSARDPMEEKKHRRLLIKFRFKAIVRRVIANRYWLSELEDTKLGENVRKNVAIIVHSKTLKGVFNIREKTILNTPLEYRTFEQKKRLIQIMTGMNCFRRYPPKVRARLASVTFYLYITKGRTIVREYNNASALYFIISGEVEIFKRRYMPSEECYRDIPVGKIGPGDMFGEVALLLDIKRTATCITRKDTELLCVYKKDFDEILKETLLAQWDDICLSLDRFQYFTDWTTGQKRECCILASIKQYNPQSIIYSEDRGLLTKVHFVLSGNCQILQCLKMSQKIVGGQKTYKLVDVDAVKYRSQEIIDKLHAAANNLASKESIKDDGNIGGMNANIMELIENYKHQVQAAEQDEIDEAEKMEEGEDSEEKSESDKSSDISDEMLKMKHNISLLMEEVSTTKIDHTFIDAGTYSCGSVFGLGEQMEHRSILARNVVQCLVVPRYWLLQKSQNAGNIWQRLKMYLDTSIPSRQKLFDDYLATKNWMNYRKALIKSLVNRDCNKNATQLSDVPRVCRMEEGGL